MFVSERRHLESQGKEHRVEQVRLQPQARSSIQAKIIGDVLDWRNIAITLIDAKDWEVSLVTVMADQCPHIWDRRQFQNNSGIWALSD